MIAKNYRLIVWGVITAILMSGCIYRPKAKISPTALAEGERHLVIELQNDPDLVAFDIRERLESRGFKVDDATSEAQSGMMVMDESKKQIRTYDRVTDSRARYALVVAYSRGGSPYRIAWRARIVDVQSKRTLGTYTYDWNGAVALTFAKSNADIIADMLARLVMPVFRNAGSQ